MPGHKSCIYSICFSPDGRILATTSHDGTTTLWDVQTGSVN
ncbi:MAG: WD40 repeat domain-containing protein [Leptolyngbya sp. BL-A-14]